MESLEIEDSLQFFKEEKTDGAVYNLYLKKVRYHTAPEDVGIGGFPGAGNSTFYLNIPGADDPDDHKARLQWRIEEIRVIRYGTPECLVEAISLQDGELDSTYVNMLLSTYRSFMPPKELLELLLERYRAVGEHPKMKQHIKEAHRKCIRTLISVWMDNYGEDFREPPHFVVLNKVREYASRHMPESNLAQRAGQLVYKFRTEDETSGVIRVEDVSLDFHMNLLKDADFLAESYLTRPLDFESISPKMMAAQLTYIDAELFKKVVPYQCLGSVWSRRDKKNTQASSVFATVNQFNAVSYRVIATVLKHPDLPPTDRVQVLERWIDIAQELRVLKNFSALKAIISGLRSNPVYRLHRVWAEIERDKLEQFDEMSEVFSEEDNQAKVRALLMKEGTAKFADPENYNTIRGHGRKKSGGGGWGTAAKKRSNFDVPSVVQGTVPYLGTFLTDLTMIDTAIPDRNEEGLINVDKKRKEFEILAQIRMLQSAAHLYKLRPAEAFFEWFHSVRIYDDNESYELSCDIEPVTPITPVLVKGHKKKSSLGFFPSRRLPSLEDLFEQPISTSTTPNQSMSSVFSSPERESDDLLKPVLHHSKSTGSIRSYSSIASLSPWKSPESCVVKVYMETNDSHFTNFYKSIVLNNCDHTKHVLKNILAKFDIEARPEDYVLFQLLPDNELQIPDRGNVFYAMNCEAEELKVVVRKKSDIERLKSRHLKGKARRKGQLTF